MSAQHSVLTAAVILSLLLAGCARASEETTTTTTAAPAQTTTTVTAVETTTQPPVTLPPELVYPVPATTAIGVLQPYSPDGGDLFPAGSVEAHWYQWNGMYVVLYRGFDAASGQEICAGNSILPPTGSWIFVTNAPYLGAADAICVGAAKITGPPNGVYACGSLLYYLTEIPIDEEGTLYGTLEIGTDAGFDGQTSEAVADPGVPEFNPGLGSYELLPTDVDPGGIVTCQPLK